MVIVRREETEEGYVIPFQQTELKCGTQLDGSNPSLAIIWPVTVSHKIDDESPLYDLKPSNNF
jgi:potassium inwardly-rectifying channel subfamily J